MNDNIYYKVHFARHFFLNMSLLLSKLDLTSCWTDSKVGRVTLSPIILETVTKFKFKKCLWKNIMEPFRFRNLLFSTLLSRSMKHSFDKWIASVKHKTDITSISKSVWNNKNCQHGERNKYLVPRELKPPRVGWIFKYTCKWCEINLYCKTKWNEFKLCQDVSCDYMYM